jgi:hypothetical protein
VPDHLGIQVLRMQPPVAVLHDDDSAAGVSRESRARLRKESRLMKIPHINLPLQTDDDSLYLWIRDDKGTSYPIAQMRGWGHLTGQGGLALSDEDAEEIQVLFADAIVRAVNNHQVLLDAAVQMLAWHDERARAANFRQCGCVDCDAFRPVVDKAKGGGR